MWFPRHDIGTTWEVKRADAVTIGEHIVVPQVDNRDPVRAERVAGVNVRGDDVEFFDVEGFEIFTTSIGNAVMVRTS